LSFGIHTRSQTWRLEFCWRPKRKDQLKTILFGINIRKLGANGAPLALHKWCISRYGSGM
jgi:hypothetical protein